MRSRPIISNWTRFRRLFSGHNTEYHRRYVDWWIGWWTRGSDWGPTNGEIYPADFFFYRTDLEKLDFHQNRPTISIQERVDVVNCHLSPVLGTQTQWQLSFHFFTISYMLKVPFYFFKSLVKRVLHDCKTKFSIFLTLTPPITTQYRLNPRENVLSHILTLVQSLWTSDMIRLSSITLFWGTLSVLPTKLTSETPLLINISCFWT